MKKAIIFKSIIVLFLGLTGMPYSNAQTFEYKSHTNAAITNYSMPYRLFIPTGYNANTSYPLVLFLHGAADRGTDNNTPLNSSRGAKLWAEPANQASHPCFVLVPQCPAEKGWVNTNWYIGSYSIDNVPMSDELKMVKDIIDTLENQYNIDASRLYITGLSMGGFGSWDFIIRYPNMFKAAIPICGAGDPSKASLIGTVPLRVFHSSDDPIVPVSGSRDMVNAINALGPNTRTEFYTEYTDQGHFSFVYAYDRPDLVNWLFTANPIKLGLTDITDEPGTITAQSESQPNFKSYATDNDATTKWLDLATADPTTRASWIQYQLSGSAYVVTEYTITSASDFPERDPKNWSLLGSNGGSVWTVLDTRTDQVFSSRSQKNSYSITNSAAYIYYRLQINSVSDPSTATGIQLAELEILGIPAVNNITMSPTTLDLDINDLRQLYATVAPSNATPTVTWSSSNEAVATVSTTGLVTAIAPGLATITAAAANNNKTATCSVTVFKNVITKFEAEDATLNGLNLVKDQEGYSGIGFVANFGNTGNSVQFSIKGATEGSQNIILRYAHAMDQDTKLHLYVNGTMIKQVIFPTTGSWGGWTDHVDNVTLNAGNNTIKYKKDAGDGGLLNVDYLGLRNIDNSVGIIEIANNENDVSLFPNPLYAGSLSIKLPAEAIRFSIVDLTGKVVYQQQVVKNEFQIDRSVFKSVGVYIVNVVTEKGTMNKKIIITK